MRGSTSTFSGQPKPGVTRYSATGGAIIGSLLTVPPQISNQGTLHWPTRQNVRSFESSGAVVQRMGGLDNVVMSLRLACDGRHPRQL